MNNHRGSKYSEFLVPNEYFSRTVPSLTNKMSQANEAIKALPNPDQYGVFKSADHYLGAVDALITSTYETEHRTEILNKEVIPKIIKNTNNFLDIGVGNGDLTNCFGHLFVHTTVIDPKQEALDRIPNKFPLSGMSVTKKHGDILDESLNIFDKKYDFILMSHVIYYIPNEKREALITKLYNSLSDDGVMAIVYNSGGSRYQLNKHFHSANELDNLMPHIVNKYNSVNVIMSPETIYSNNLNTIMQIAGVCLNDGGANATKEELESFFEGYYNDGIYNITMTQNIVLIGAINEV